VAVVPWPVWNPAPVTARAAVPCTLGCFAARQYALAQRHDPRLAIVDAFRDAAYGARTGRRVTVRCPDRFQIWMPPCSERVLFKNQASAVRRAAPPSAAPREPDRRPARDGLRGPGFERGRWLAQRLRRPLGKAPPLCSRTSWRLGPREWIEGMARPTPHRVGTSLSIRRAMAATVRITTPGPEHRCWSGPEAESGGGDTACVKLRRDMSDHRFLPTGGSMIRIGSSRVDRHGRCRRRRGPGLALNTG
jgi:hypothetical protein